MGMPPMGMNQGPPQMGMQMQMGMNGMQGGGAPRPQLGAGQRHRGTEGAGAAGAGRLLMTAWTAAPPPPGMPRARFHWA